MLPRVPFAAATLLMSAALTLPAFAQPQSKSAPAAPSGAGAKTGSGPTIANFLRVRTPTSVQLGPKGEVYCIDWQDGVNQLFKRGPGADAKAPMKRLTDFKDGISSYSISDDGRWATLSAGVGGNENTNVWLLNLADDSVVPVLQNKDVQFRVDAWLHDGSGFLYRGNDANPRDFHLYRYDIASKQSAKILAREGDWTAGDITRDGGRALVSVYRSASDSRAYELDIKTGSLRDISATAEGTESANTIVGYLPGERQALVQSDARDGKSRLFIRDLADAAGAPVKEALPSLGAWELDAAALNPEKTFLVTSHNEDGYSTLRAFALPSFQEAPLPRIDRGLQSASFLRGSTLVYTLNNAKTPTLAYLTDLAKPAEPKPLTARMDNETLDLTGFALPQLVKYTSFDGLEVPAFLYLPAGAAKGRPVPFVVNYHGGPEGQSRPVFDRVSQYLVSRGYGVMLPNVRGSTGYGRDYQMMDNYKKRWDSVKDGVEAAKWLVAEGYAQKGRIATYGGSYGGFMSVACLVEGGDLFGAGIDIVGIVNMQTFLQQTSGYRRALREAEYGPLTDPEFLKSISPLLQVDRIKVPMMIGHGLNDPRVPVGEAMQLAVTLQERGDDPELVFFPDEGHGFAKLRNRIIFYERMVRFLDRHIGNAKK